ncbi:MAG: glutathione S-transferase family protein [Cyanomargarita calcarea GSE-NOS-MK-12-04C]|jgi:glutathione S-transferase|uniref:Glutathione S-transferase family protein n=1 Tax=Cyanomargarita calcarea GSE-NOS-MK-12-04C TaxID=2839659 RepID=A0A951QPZ4_9CYAN|nr:glutathione S-transferase family protein [Cyanomargarita calcarea GSE-NOS-MK-12-04C]
MLKLYQTPISPNSRRVWVVLLEKNLEFELVEIKLDGDQMQPEYLALNPFHHIPVLVDDGFTIVESLAILDYLEAKYPTPAMLPADVKDLATVRMIEMVAVNELLPALNAFFPIFLGLSAGEPEKIEQSKQKISVVLKFLESLLGDRPYFGSESLTLAEAVAGTIVPVLPRVGVSLSEYPKLSAWCDRLIERPAWQTSEPTPENIEAFKTIVLARMAR